MKAVWPGMTWTKPSGWGIINWCAITEPRRGRRQCYHSSILYILIIRENTQSLQYCKCILASSLYMPFLMLPFIVHCTWLHGLHIQSGRQCTAWACTWSTLTSQPTKQHPLSPWCACTHTTARHWSTITCGMSSSADIDGRLLTCISKPAAICHARSASTYQQLHPRK